MPKFLNTKSRPTLGIGICDRCRRKLPLDELMPDGNSPGLRVCKNDWDYIDPHRLPQHESENITLPFVRPDEPLTY